MLHLQGCHFQHSFSLSFSSVVFVDDSLELYARDINLDVVFPLNTRLLKLAVKVEQGWKRQVCQCRGGPEREADIDREREWEQAHSESCWEQWIIHTALTAEPLSPTPHFLHVQTFIPRSILSIYPNANFRHLFLKYLKSTCFNPHLGYHVIRLQYIEVLRLAYTTSKGVVYI